MVKYSQIILELESEMLFLPCILGKAQSLEQIDKANHPMVALENQWYSDSKAKRYYKGKLR